ncbi:MAG: hypothetical protein NZL90_01320 [Aquificaceae bacterium]|nr:hypothetical protein [Aquificaceae bacterium]MDW8237168.1 hypothetical protein [Aquificaceae bacterium]
MRREKRKFRLSKYLEFLLVFTILGAMFYMPSATDNVEFFRARTLYLTGLETVPSELVKDAVSELRANWLLISEENLSSRLNQRCGNCIKSVSIDRSFSKEGVDLVVKITERKAFVAVLDNNGLGYYDDTGFRFSSLFVKYDGIVIFTKDRSLVERNFDGVNLLVSNLGNTKLQLSEAFADRQMTIIRLKDGSRVILPPLFELSRETLRKVLLIESMVDSPSEFDLIHDRMIIVRGISSNGAHRSR